MNTLKLLNFIWGFILTKWYVNQCVRDILEAGSPGFILTKWYVNLVAMSFIPLIAEVLY